MKLRLIEGPLSSLTCCKCSPTSPHACAAPQVHMLHPVQQLPCGQLHVGLHVVSLDAVSCSQGLLHSTVCFTHCSASMSACGQLHVGLHVVSLHAVSPMSGIVAQHCMFCTLFSCMSPISNNLAFIQHAVSSASVHLSPAQCQHYQHTCRTSLFPRIHMQLSLQCQTPHALSTVHLACSGTVVCRTAPTVCINSS